MTDQNFTVDLHGVVELLSNHLYSGPQVFVRELLQNGVDALTARAETENPGPDHTGSVSFSIGETGGRPTLTVTDEGLGLTQDEAEMFMSVIGRSSKRDEIGMARESLIGQFGVGILSCFAVSEAITVTSRSASGGTPIVWTGRADGTWSTRHADEDHPVGSTVTLVARPGEERYFDHRFVERHLRSYGELLPHRVWLAAGSAAPILITKNTDALRNPTAPIDEVLDLGRELLGFDPLDSFPISSAVGQAHGVAYVLPYEPAPNASRADRVYVKGMLVSPETDRLLPSWAFFVRCIVEADGLSPTASREELHTDETLAMTRDELGRAVRDHLVQLAGSNSPRLAQMIKVHHQAMKALAIHDPEFLRLVIDWLPIEGSEGQMSFGDFRRRHPVAAYTRTVDEFRQLAPIATAQGLGLLCGGYTHDEALIAAAVQHLDDFTANPVQVEDLFGGFGLLSAEEKLVVGPLLSLARERIAAFGADTEVRRFEPHETPALLAMDDTAFRLRSLQREQEQSGDLFAGIVASVSESFDESNPVFCLNIANPIVARLIRIAGGASPHDDSSENQGLIVNAIEVLYLQALLMGHHPLQITESALLNTSLSSILDRATRGSTDR